MRDIRLKAATERACITTLLYRAVDSEYACKRVKNYTRLDLLYDGVSTGFRRPAARRLYARAIKAELGARTIEAKHGNNGELVALYVRVSLTSCR